MQMMHRMLFLSDGEMMLWEDGRVRPLHAARRAQYIRTARELQERNAWKYEGAGAKFQHQTNPYAGAGAAAETACRIRDVAALGDRLVYALVAPEMGGLYTKALDDPDAPEGNLLSERGFRPREMHIQGDDVVMAVEQAGLESHIALMKAGSGRYEVITQGDTQDSAPFLCPDGRTLYYVSAGWARNQAGVPLAKGPSALLRLDLRYGDLAELRADRKYDYLRPREAPDGHLYVIRRPYRSEVPRRATLADRVKHAGAFFKGLGRLFEAIGDPEGTAARTPRVIGQSAEEGQRRVLEGVMLDITRTTDQAEDGGFVPADWVLMRENPEGELEVVRQGVADYDFDGEALIWSDGRRILRSENGRTTVLYRGVFIPRIVVCR